MYFVLVGWNELYSVNNMWSLPCLNECIYHLYVLWEDLLPRRVGSSLPNATPRDKGLATDEHRPFASLSPQSLTQLGQFAWPRPEHECASLVEHLIDRL